MTEESKQPMEGCADGENNSYEFTKDIFNIVKGLQNSSSMAEELWCVVGKRSLESLRLAAKQIGNDSPNFACYADGIRVLYSSHIPKNCYLLCTRKRRHPRDVFDLDSIPFYPSE